MRYKSVKIQNYKSFNEMEPIELTPGFNVVIGKNNSGKTAFVQVLSLDFPQAPHTSLATKPEERTPVNPNSKLHSSLVVQTSDLRSLLFNRATPFHLPKKPNVDMERERVLLEQAFSNPEAEIEFSYENKKMQTAHLLPTWNVKSTTGYAVSLETLSEKPKIFDQATSWNSGNDLANIVANSFIPRVYSFKAERFHVGQSSTGTSDFLEPDASNLPAVLLKLKSEKTMAFTNMLAQFQIVFPEFEDINLRLIADNEVKIFLSSTSLIEERFDLDVPLQDSGTGIGQVLAMLYVVNTSKYPQVFVIDEPQSFLHPDAIRNLFSILSKDFSEHQYIITTHSPSVISAANPSTMIHLKKREHETTATTVNARERAALGSVLADVGARLSDVFGADSVLWVEGATEEQSFPLIVNKLCKRSLLGTTILGVINKGDFEQKSKKDVDLALRVYKKLSQSPALIPPMLGFLFDREGLSPAEVDELTKRLKGKVSFLKKRMYENYLVSPEALEVLISTLSDFSETKPVVEVIKKWINKHKWESAYFDVPIEKKARTDEVWISAVKADRFLDAMFKDLSETRYEYIPHKVEYGFFLTQWLSDNAPNELQEIADLIDSIFETPEE